MDGTNNVKERSSFVTIMMIQAIFVLILISAVFCCKYFLKGDFLRITGFYTEKICAQTDVNEVLKGDYLNEI